ncbi:MAG: TIGR03936 family radical SAM-associated protein [Treponema sp.]|nr:TIGR03936 family radical SAM-associated protein [Treponema sp.]
MGAGLLGVEKPARYCGGEYGRLAKKESAFQTLIAFPDLYEIGMSNQAFRIIYNNLNNISGISCDRAFAPAPDFENLLRDRGLPLYGLDTGISLKSLDLLLFTLGYELGFSGILAMLDVSGIPLRCEGRGEDDPLIIAGGPAVSNPLPYSAFVDAFWIGEAEAGFFDLAAELREIRQNGGGRAALLERIAGHPHVWVRGKEKAYRAVDADFAKREDPPSVFPVPGMKTVQHHGTLEIMRGCPNGCRFCHAGYWYRPMRQKNRAALVREAEAFIILGGYREMSLSSLSTGDYNGIGDLVDDLNARFSARHVSFQLPSLRVSTFSLSLLEKISQTRKSGLTFAVETPLDFWQMAINKQVAEDSVVEILHEAKRNGWRGAKFYFMIGLPVPPPPDVQGGVSEEEAIVHFICNVSRRTSMHFNINVGIFVPKPHTPYQWARQLGSETAAAKLAFIRSRLKTKGHKVSASDSLVSMIEGILSRGDERAGDLAEAAFRAGSRLDAWQEFINREAWQGVIETNAALVGNFLGAKDPATPPPWQSIVSGVSPAYLRKELEKSDKAKMTITCEENCTAPCGACAGNNIVRNISRQGAEAPNLWFASTQREESVCNISRRGAEAQSTQREEGGSDFEVSEFSTEVTRVLEQQPPLPSPRSLIPIPHSPVPNSKSDPTVWRLLFSFTKEGSAVFHGHLSLIEIFSMAMTRAGIDVQYTQGFNPLAKLEIVSPLSVGISAGAEIAAVDFSHAVQPAEFAAKMNAALPDGIVVKRAECYRIPAGSKKRSLSSLLWGFGYTGIDGEAAYVPAAGEKAHREKCLGDGAAVFSLRRACVLAKNIVTSDEGQQPWASYFNVYKFLYG